MQKAAISQELWQGESSLTGLFMAGIVISIGLGSLIWLLTLDITQMGVVAVLGAIAVRTFLHTGLFITAHDAMHGSICPQNPRLNHQIGALATTLYAFLPYESLLRKHHRHHRYPASAKDPDFYPEAQHSFAHWFFRFMQGYFDKRQLGRLFVGMTIIFYGLWLGFQIPVANLILFWLLPIILSSVQLFYFGIFLPHRPSERGYSDTHRAVSLYYPAFWSLLACYHFGYHWEHHQYPHLAWYQLPSVTNLPQKP